MSNGFQYRLYEMEVAPPPQVWEKLAANLDEINADNLIADKICKAESLPPATVWEKIKKSFFENEKAEVEKKGFVIKLKRLVAAAIFVGIIASVWFLFFNTHKKNENLAFTETLRLQEKIIKPGQAEVTPAEPGNKNQLPIEKSLTRNFTKSKNKQADLIPINIPVQPVYFTRTNSISIQNEKPNDKIFNRPIDDLTMVASGDNYMTMVNANGRMVKIPAHLAHLAPHLQNKPVTEDYYEFLFGEGAYWKEQLNDWRQKLATAPVTSGDIFSTMVELLKSLQEK